MFFNLEKMKFKFVESDKKEPSKKTKSIRKSHKLQGKAAWTRTFFESIKLILIVFLILTEEAAKKEPVQSEQPTLAQVVAEAKTETPFKFNFFQ